LVKLTPLSPAALQVAELGAALAHAQAQPMLEPAARRLARRSEPPPAERGQARIVRALIGLNRPMYRQAIVEFDPDRPAKAIDRQPLDKVGRCFFLAIEQQVVAIRPDQEIEQALALRRQKSRPDRKLAAHVLRYQALQEWANILARKSDHGSVGKGGSGHGA
jgi:hypothetical protein